MVYDPENDQTRGRNAYVHSGDGVTKITATGTALDVSAVVVPGPAGLNDYFSAEIDETGVPLNPIPAAVVPIILPLLDLVSGVPFTSQGIIFENRSGKDLWISFDPLAAPGTFERVINGRRIALDAKGATSIAILDPTGVGGGVYNAYAWG